MHYYNFTRNSISSSAEEKIKWANILANISKVSPLRIEGSSNLNYECPTEVI